MQILARFTNFCDFYDFWKAVATAFLRISKTPMVNVEIRFCSFLFVQKFLSPSVTNLCPRKVEFRVQTERFFGNARRKTTKFNVIPVWSGKTVLEMLFVESTSLIRPIYMAFQLKPLTEVPVTRRIRFHLKTQRTISLRFHLLFTRKRWKRSWKRKHLNTQSKVDRFENATKWKRNDLKTYPCNRSLSRIAE